MRKNAISLRVIVPIVLVLTLVSFVLRTFLGYVLRMTADDAARWSLWVTIVLGSVTLLAGILIAVWQSASQSKSEAAREDANVCDQIVLHLTAWHDALRKAVRKNSRIGIRLAMAGVSSPAVEYQLRADDLEEFKLGVYFQGPLEGWLDRLRAIPGSDDAVKFVSDFEEVALRSKEEISRLYSKVSQLEAGALSEEKRRELETSKAESLEVVRRAYRNAQQALQALAASIRRRR